MKSWSLATCLALLLSVTACTGEGPSDGNEATAEENFMGENMIASGGDPAEEVWCEVLEQEVPRKDCEQLSKIAEVTDGSAALNVPDPMNRGDRIDVKLIVDRRTPQVIEQLDAMAIENVSASGNEMENAAHSNASGDEGPIPSEGDTPSPVDVGNLQDPVTEPVEPEPSASQNPTPKQQAGKMPGTTESFDLKVGRQMRAELTGQGFEINPMSPAVQQIPKGDQASWTWEVIALQGGPKTLTVRTVVEASVNGRTYRLRQTEYHKTVQVGVSLWDRIKDWLRELPESLQLISAALTALAGVAGAWWLVKRNWRSGPGSSDLPPPDSPADGDR